MKITTLLENSAIEGLASEHGLSLYIETKEHKILFDAGASDAFADNAEKLGIDLSQVDLCILSHGHYDHSGGLSRFLELNDHAPVYLSQHAFTPCYHGQERYIGVDQSLKDSDRLVFCKDVKEIDRGLTLLSCNGKPSLYPIDSAGLTVLENGTYTPDTFVHEQYLLIEEHGKRVLISGCSHKGILNIAHWFSPDVLIGGFHFMNLDPETDDSLRLLESSERLLQHDTVYYTGHCTGEAPYAFMKKIMKDKLHALCGGTSIQI